jgi:hypothetical protein
MTSPTALRLAFNLARKPGLAKAMRRQPLPPDVLVLIRIVAGSPETCRAAATATGKSLDVIKGAATAFLQQILFHESSDSYRTLGASPDASRETLREHLRWLMKWLHPDRNYDDWEIVFAERVLRAWEDVKSVERRAAYDRARKLLVPSRMPGNARRLHPTAKKMRPARRLGWISTPIPPAARNTMIRRTLALALACSVGLAVLIFHN